MTPNSLSPLRILMVEDNEHDRVAFRRAFRKHQVPVEITEFVRAEDALQHVQHDVSQFDIVVSDYKLPGMSGLVFCEKLLNMQIPLPLVLLTGRGSEHLAIDALKSGVNDYLVKDPDGGYLSLLPIVLPEVVQQYHDRLARKQAEEALQKLNAELEQRVQKRTRQLQQANQELHDTLETLKNTQDQLIQAEKMALLLTLVAEVAHEINNPLGIGLTAASHLEEQTQDLYTRYQQGQMKRSDLEKYLTTAVEVSTLVVSNVKRASEYVQSFKQVAVDQASGEQRRFHLKTYLEEIFLSLRPKLKRTKHRIMLHCPDDIELESYPGAFSQIISNLVINSLVHGFEHNDAGEIQLEITSQDDLLSLTYRDNGKGMDEEQCSKVFDAFFTTKREQGGSGLGMNIVHNLVTQKLHGQIRCESIPGEGTTFAISLPK